MEKYKGSKFKTIFLSNNLPSTYESKELIKWFRKFHDIGIAPEYKLGSSGNLSFRYKKGFVIKSTKTYFDKINEKELVFVEKFEKNTAYVHGRMLPSTELQMHQIIYRNKKDVNAIFHLHDYEIMKHAKKFKIPITRVTEAGTEKIGYDVLRHVDDKNFVIMKNHGVVSLGKNMQEAGFAVLKYHALSSNLQKS